MSDLIPTPSRTQSAVSNDAFEVLIDLLTTDGTGESATSRANVSLRDPSGKLDFNKIRLMFASQHVQKRVAEEKARSPSPYDGDSDDERCSHQSAPSTAPSRSTSMSPQPVEHTTVVGHRRSSTFGNQPWTPIHGNVTGGDGPPVLVPLPLSLDELNTALASAQEEVKSLRQKYEELQALVSKRFETETRDRSKPHPCAVNTNGRDISPRAEPSMTLSADVPTEIANFSENEAKRTLGVLVRSLGLSPSALSAMAGLAPAGSAPPQQSLSPPSWTRRHDVASIARALKFLGTVDELVWRRTSSAPSGPRTLLPVFSEENVTALVARLELWERAVRRSVGY